MATMTAEQRQQLKRIQDRTTHGFVSSRPCGCVNFLSMDDPEMSPRDRRETQQRIGELVADGCKVERLPVADVRAASQRFGYCDACRPAPKIKPPQQGGLFAVEGGAGEGEGAGVTA